MVYKSICITTVVYRSHLKTLEKFHQRCLRKIHCIRWEDRRTNASILITPSIEAMVMHCQLRWAANSVRVPDNRFPRKVLFAQLTRGMRTRGGQKKQFKDIAKHYMKKGQIYTNAWEHIAADRPLWRLSVYQATAKCERNRLLHDAEKHRGERRGRFLNIFTSLHLEPPSGTSCSHSNNICRSRIGNLSHLRIYDGLLEDVILISRDRDDEGNRYARLIIV